VHLRSVNTLVCLFTQGFVLWEVGVHVKVVWRSAITDAGVPFVKIISITETHLSPASCLATGNWKQTLIMRPSNVPREGVLLAHLSVRPSVLCSPSVPYGLLTRNHKVVEISKLA